MSEVSMRDLKELTESIAKLQSQTGVMEERIEGINHTLTLHLGRIDESIEFSRADRRHLHDKVESLKDQIRDKEDFIRKDIKNLEIQVAKLLGKWSIIIILIAGILSITANRVLDNGTMRVPEVLPPKTEQPTSVIRIQDPMRL